MHALDSKPTAPASGVSGDTLLAVADGRGCISIRDAAESGNDIPVYTLDILTQRVSVNWARVPRATCTGTCALVRVHLTQRRLADPHPSETQGYIDVAPGHLFALDNARLVPANTLRRGDTLPAFTQRGDAVSVRTLLDKEDTAVPPQRAGAPYVYDNGTQRYKARVALLGGSPMLADTDTPHAFMERVHTRPRAWDARNYGWLMTHARSLGLTLCLSPSGPAPPRFKRECRCCHAEFHVFWKRRNQCYCGASCAKHWYVEVEHARRTYTASAHGRMKSAFLRQIDIYHRLLDASSTGHVTKRQWETRCASEGVGYLFNRLADNKPWTASSWTEFKDIRESYGMRVVRVEVLPDEHTVYGVTADGDRTIAIVTKQGPSPNQLTGAYIFHAEHNP